MKCYYHPDRDAVSMCGDCGVGLCKECTDKHNPIICDKCYEKECQETENEYKYEIRSDIWGFYLTAFIGIGLVWFAFRTNIIGGNGLPFSAFQFLIVYFLPFAFRGIRRYFQGGGCLLMILKFIVGWFFGFVFYGWQLVKSGRTIRRNEIKTSKGVVKELLFISSNLIITLALFYIICLMLTKSNIRLW